MFEKMMNGPLMDPEPNQGGGDQKPPEPPPAPDLAKLLADMQKGLIGEFDKRVNGINKETTKTAKQIEALTAGLTSLKADIESRFKQQEPIADDLSDDDNADDAQGGSPEPPQPPPQQRQSRHRDNQQPQQQHQAPAPPAPPARPKKDPHTIALERQIEELKKQREADQEAMKRTNEAADKKDRIGTLKATLSKHKFSDETMQNDFFKLLIPDVIRGEDGNVYGPEGVDLDEYVKAEYDRRPALHPAKPVNGAGATQSANAPGGGRKFDIDDIGADMTPEQLEAATAAIIAAMPQQQRGGRR